MNAAVTAIAGERPLAPVAVVAPAAPSRAPIVATPFVLRDPTTIPTRQFLYGRHAIRKFMSLTVAPGGIGKTALTLAEGVALATGRDLLHDGVREAAPVWYLGLEDPLEEYERRLAGIALHYGITADDLAGSLFLDSGRDQRFVIAADTRAGVTLHAPVVAEITATILANGIALVIVDPFVASHTVPESDNTAIATVAAAWARIADETGCAVELVHHVRKGNGMQEASADDARGASALVNAARSVRILTPMTKDEAAQAKVEQRRRFFQITNGKANLYLPPDAATWRKLETASLGNGTDGPDDEVGVATAWAFPSALDGLGVHDLDAVRERIGTDPVWREDYRATNWVGFAVAEVLGLDANDNGDRKRIRKMLTTWTQSDALRVVHATGRDRHIYRYTVKGEGAAA